MISPLMSHANDMPHIDSETKQNDTWTVMPGKSNVIWGFIP